jgi:hypothetical protein
MDDTNRTPARHVPLLDQDVPIETVPGARPVLVGPDQRVREMDVGVLEELLHRRLEQTLAGEQ